MNKNLVRYILITTISCLFVTGTAQATNIFPATGLNNWVAGNTIEEGWANALEAKIGADSSSVTTSHDYLIKNAAV